MKTITLASLAVLLAAGLSGSANAQVIKDVCAISHGGNWENAPDSCHKRLPGDLLSHGGDHTPPSTRDGNNLR